MLELIDYLKSAGYIEKNAKADQSRSRFTIVEGKLVIEPGVTGTLDGGKGFPAVSVSFAKDGKSVNGIADLDQRLQVDKIKLEPKMLSTVAARAMAGDVPSHSRTCRQLLSKRSRSPRTARSSSTTASTSAVSRELSGGVTKKKRTTRRSQTRADRRSRSSL
jgi:hypothetical protein